MRRTAAAALSVGVLLAGCERSPSAMTASGEPVEDTAAEAAGGSDRRDASAWGDLPSWAQRTAELHGGLGPWAISGAIAGREARERLAVQADESLAVVYNVPEERRNTGELCVMDGLQVGAGVSMGKQSIALAYEQSLDPFLSGPDGAPAPLASVFVVRGPDGHLRRGLRAVPTDALLTLLHEPGMQGLAYDARRLLGMPVTEVFEFSELTPAQLHDAAHSLGAPHDHGHSHGGHSHGDDGHDHDDDDHDHDHGHDHEHDHDAADHDHSHG